MKKGQGQYKTKIVLSIKLMSKLVCCEHYLQRLSKCEINNLKHK